ncbi:MAG: metallophosphoesterase [Nitrospiraceae bacterium]
MDKTNERVRIAAVADLHCPRAFGVDLQSLFASISEQADVLLLSGDLTDYGLPDEARILSRKLAATRIPILAVLGNHDYECDRQGEVERILSDAGVIMLNGNPAEVHGIGFVGVKGFAGGFGDRMLQPWGEEVIKRFVHAAVDESLKLESGLAKLRTPQRIVLLHYSPVRDTVQGEPSEIVPFLGCSRLEEPLNRFPVTAVFHGHAHHGTLEGKTRQGIPVYNVAMPLLSRMYPDRPPFRLIEVNVPENQETMKASIDGPAAELPGR